MSFYRLGVGLEKGGEGKNERKEVIQKLGLLLTILALLFFVGLVFSKVGLVFLLNFKK